MNLLPLNAAPGIPFERPSDERVDAFAQILADRGVTVSVRKSRGRDIRAACGQLIVDEARSPRSAKLGGAGSRRPPLIQAGRPRRPVSGPAPRASWSAGIGPGALAC